MILRWAPNAGFEYSTVASSIARDSFFSWESYPQGGKNI